MEPYEHLICGSYYHIYNRGIDSCNLFREDENYAYFMKLYQKHISPVAVTLAWVLMPNHFHFLVRIREYERTLSGSQTLTGLKSPHQYFSNLFNAYSQALNKRYKRHGALFERPFKRKLIQDETFLRDVLVYIHNNPVHHGFCKHPSAYPWSSYQDYFSSRPLNISREEGIDLFDDIENFKFCHEEKVSMEIMNQELENQTDWN